LDRFDEMARQFRADVTFQALTSVEAMREARERLDRSGERAQRSAFSVGASIHDARGTTQNPLLGEIFPGRRVPDDGIDVSQVQLFSLMEWLKAGDAGEGED